MLQVDEALAMVLERATPIGPRELPTADALGLVLAEGVTADIDLPPFDKALVDGYALRSTEYLDGRRTFRVIEEVPAGRTPTRPIGPGEATLVMTGAPLPEGADTVVMHERTARDGESVRVHETEVVPGRNRLGRGREMRAGDVVLERGAVLNPARLGLLASVGRTRVRAVPRPSVAVLPTGDELVDPALLPGPGQIRNSNGPMLQALAAQAGGVVRPLGIVRDEIETLTRAIRVGLTDDVLLVTGGVSAGNRDLVPEALAGLGVERVFHKIHLKPGKPLWFGVGPSRAGGPGTLVFGLPGNPVSSVVGFLLFVGPALDRLAGRDAPADRSIEARLVGSFRHSGDRPTYHPARLTAGPSGVEPPAVTPLDWAGSADLRTVAWADGFVHFPAGDRDYAVGEIVRFVSLG